MADVKWIKIVTDIFSNRKIKQIESMPDADAILVIWFKLLCLAGNINEGGLITITKDIPYTDEMLAAEFHRPLSTVRLALGIFEQFGMIEIVESILCVSNWEKYQNVDTLDKMREQTRKRVATHREKQRALASCNVTVTLPVTQCNATDRDIDRDIEKENIGGKSTRFTPPTLEEVQAYCRERNRGVDPQKWIDHYTAKGWLIGKTKMKDWKAAVRTWEQTQTKGADTDEWK